MEITWIIFSLAAALIGLFLIAEEQKCRADKKRQERFAKIDAELEAAGILKRA